MVEKNDLRKRIREVQGEDKKVVKAVEELKRAGMKILRDER